MIQQLYHKKAEVRTMEEGKNIHRENDAQKVTGFGDFQTRQNKAQVPEDSKSVLLKSGAVILLFWPPFTILAFTFMQSVSLRFLPNFTQPSTASMRFSRVSPLISFSITVSRSSAQCYHQKLAAFPALLGLSCTYHGGFSSP